MAASAETKARVLALLNPQSTPTRGTTPAGGLAAAARKAGKIQRRADKRRDAKDGGGGGGILGAAFGNPLVKGALTALDYPRRGLLWSAGSSGYAWDKYVLGDDEKAAKQKRIAAAALRGEYGGDEILEDAGVHIKGKYGRFAAGLGIDILTDPLTYTGVGAVVRGGAKVTAEALLREGGERFAMHAAQEAGVSTADRIAMHAIRAEGDNVAREAATRVAREGTSSLSNSERRLLLGQTGGAKLTVPGTGRIGRKITGAEREIQATIVPKGITDLVNRPAARLRTAFRESSMGDSLLTKFGGEESQRALKALAQSGDSNLAVPAIKTMAIQQSEQARSSVLFRELLKQYSTDVRPKIKRHLEDVVDLAESGAKEGAPLREFFVHVADEVRAKTGGAIDLRRDGDYVPLIETKEARAARTGKKAVEGAGGYSPTIKSKLRAVFGDSAARTEFERFAEETYGLKGAYFERHPDKIVPIYLQVLERKVARELALQRMQEAGIIKQAFTEERVLDLANIKRRGKLANKAAASEQRASAAQGRAQQLLGEQADATQKVLGRAAAPIEGPPVEGFENLEMKQALLDSRELAAEERLLADARAPFDAIGVRTLRKIGTAQGIPGAHRLLKSELVERLGDMAISGELKGAVAAVADEPLLRAHDLVFASPFRKSVQSLGEGAMADIDKAYKYLDQLTDLARRSGAEDVGYDLERAEKALTDFIRYSKNGPARLEFQNFVAHTENVLSRVHMQAMFGRGKSSADALEAEEILEHFPQFADPRARQAVFDKYYGEGDKLSGGYHVDLNAATRLNDLYGTASLTHMVKPAVDVDALQSELRAATDAYERATMDAFEASARTPEQRAIAAEFQRQTNERLKFLRAANREANKEMRTIAVLEARRAQAEAMYLRETNKALSLEAQRAALSTTKMQKQVADELMRGTHKLMDTWSGRAAPNEIADALTRVGKAATPEGWGGFLRHYDTVLNYIKAWQISSPGFHMRNTIGGVFNNFLADIDPGAYRRYWRARMGIANEADKAAFAKWREFGSIGQFGSHEVSTGLKREALLTRVNPLSAKNAYVHANQLWGGNVEDMLRGSLFMDVFKKTGDADAALDAVYKFHFNYDDLSRFESGVVRRVIPFYTWTRKNFPLQIEMMVTRPSKYAWYVHFDQQVRSNLGEPDDIVPSYYGDLWAIPTGVNAGGGQMYLTPDLPFTRTMSESLPIENGRPSLNPIASQMTPIIKTPLERIMGHQYFKDIPLTDRKEEMPSAWDSIPGLKGVLEETGIVDRKGQIAQDDAYTIEQYMPLLARLRRLAPSEKKYQDRATSTWLSFVGVPLRTNTDAEKRIEKFRRYLDRTEERTFRVPKKNEK